METMTLKEAADRLGVMEMRLLELVDVGAISPSVVERKDGNLWSRETVVLFSADDIEQARADKA